MTNPRDQPNMPYFDWSEDIDKPQREVWYSLVTTPDRKKSLWYRFTLLSTSKGHREARIWLGLTDRENQEHQFFDTEKHRLDEVDISEPFRLEIDDSVLTNHSVEGSIDTSIMDAEWRMEYEPDSFFFTPLRSKELTDMAEKTMGAGRHWSANQSVRMDGWIEFDDERIEFSDAPGHQGHTVGRSAPDRWSWLHCNSFDEDAVIETLNLDGRLSICLRLGDEAYQLNKMEHIMGPKASENRVDEVGRWSYKGSGEGLDLEVAVEVDYPELWKHVTYLTPDDTKRYLNHCSLSDISVTYRLETEDGWSEPVTLESDAARAEWAEREKTIEGEYIPREF